MELGGEEEQAAEEPAKAHLLAGRRCGNVVVVAVVSWKFRRRPLRYSTTAKTTTTGRAERYYKEARAGVRGYTNAL